MLTSPISGKLQAVTGIALPSSGAKLYSSSNDGTLRLWDCHTGQCSRVINLGSQVGSLINDGPWVFVGMPNLVKVCLYLVLSFSVAWLLVLTHYGG